MSRYLVDNSVLQRLPRSPEVQTAVNALLDAEHEFCCSSLTLDEFGFTPENVAAQARRLVASS